jgi:hypothetical protein
MFLYGHVATFTSKASEARIGTKGSKCHGWNESMNAPKSSKGDERAKGDEGGWEITGKKSERNSKNESAHRF